MDFYSFSEEDRIEALKISGTGMWRLESNDRETPSFWGDSYMNYLIGVSDDALPQDRFSIFMSRIHPDDFSLFMEYYNALKNTSKAEVVYRYMHPELGVIYVRCAGMKSDTHDGITCYRGFHQNVTNTLRIEQQTHQRMTEQAEMFRTVAFKMMQNSSDLCLRIDLEEGTTEWYSFEGPQPTQHIYYADIIQQYANLVPEEYRRDYLIDSSLINLKKQLEDKDSYNFTTFIRRQGDNELRRVTYWYFSVETNRRHVLSIFRDTTEDYLKERQLADALLMSKQANRAKTAFLNNMSHDIRTPMNAIIGFTDLAQKHLDNPKLCQDYLSKIRVSSEHLLSLINDVLDMSRIESGTIKLNANNCSLFEMMDGLKTILQTDAQNHGLHFDVDVSGIRDELVVCDKLRLNQILLNCASNSIKFTNRGGKVSVQASQLAHSSEKDGYGEYQFVVEDNGIGMSEDFSKRIFEPFTREEQQVQSIQGTGLGMTICKNLVDMMGGTIEVWSEQGVGTRFTIRLRLPLAETPFKASENEAIANENLLLGKRILLTEDNELNREIATEILKEKGALIETASNGQEAVEMIHDAANGYYDLVFMDIQMPVLNGYDATRKIRSLEREDVKSLKIIAMTANAFEEDRQRALEAGMNGHIAKPINIGEMLEVLSKI